MSFKKHPRSFFLLGIVLSTFLFFSFKKGDCTSSEMSAMAVDQLNKFTLMQEFPFFIKKKKKSEEIEYKKQMITLNRGVRYKFYAIKNKEVDGLPIITIYNNEKQEFMLGSTYNSTFKKFYNQLEFECKTSGNYCLSMSFLDGEEGCALGIFASLIKD